LSTTNSQFWSQASRIEGIAEANDLFGTSWTSGDFDHDGFDDIAVGARGENINAGAVSVLYGSATGLRVARNQLLRQGMPGLPGEAAPLDGFGSSLASGDFDRDGFADLAIGAPVDASLPSEARGGSVTIVYGTASGLTVENSDLITQDSPNVGGQAEIGDTFGFALAVGDIDVDGYSDLAIGAPHETTTAYSAGLVALFFGSPSGLNTVGSQTISQGANGLLDTSEIRDDFGTALVIGKFDGDKFRDLVVGVPGENAGGVQDVGAIIAIPGGDGGLQLGESRLLHMGLADVAGRLQASSLFGSVLERGNFNGDGYHDLVVGVWRFDIFPRSNVGAIITLSGGPEMLGGPIPSLLVTQDSGDVVDVAESFDGFGEYLKAVDANGDGTDSVFVGVPFEDVGSVLDAGAGHVFGGSPWGLVASSVTLWTQNSPGVAGSAERDDLFGGIGI
jgi:hypothetical protein